MFSNKREIESINLTIDHLEKTLEHERDMRYRLEGQFQRLMDHLGLTEAHQPGVVIVKKKAA